MAFCVRDSEDLWGFFFFWIFTACQVRFYTDATVQRENQYGDFHLPPSRLFNCSVTRRGSAVLRGQSCHSFISVSSFEYMSGDKGQRSKKQKICWWRTQNGKLERNKIAMRGGRAGILRVKKRFYCSWRNEDLGLQHQRSRGVTGSSSLCLPTLPSSLGLSLKWTTGPGWVLVDLWGQEK